MMGVSLGLSWEFRTKVIIETWRKRYNAVRSHSSLEYQTPLEFVTQWKSESITGAGVSR